MRGFVVVAVAAAALVFATGAVAASAPWSAATDARLELSEAQSSLVFGDRAAAIEQVDGAGRAIGVALGSSRTGSSDASRAIARARSAAVRGDARALAAAAATAWTTVLRVATTQVIASTARGDVDDARAWLLVREFRPPTRFTRAGTDATVALDRLAAGAIAPRVAATAVRADLLDTYDARIRSSLAAAAEANDLGFETRRAEAAAEALGYWGILGAAYSAQRGSAATRRATAAVVELAGAHGSERSFALALRAVEHVLEGFRAAPLSAAEQLRRAGQLQRFLKLVPIEYARGVENGRVTADFEIQEAITFRDGAQGAFTDLEAILLRADPAAARALGKALDQLGDDLSAASHGGSVADPELVRSKTDGALDLTGRLYPAQWKDAAKTADFDVIAATLDRLEAAAADGQWGNAESARLEAYGLFELGPEQRLRGLAPSLFRKVEGSFWYGSNDLPGLVQLLKRKASVEEIAATRASLDAQLTEAEERIGAGPQSRVSIVTNSAIIVFREGLEAVLILAALMASMVGNQRKYRRPLLIGVGLALVASVGTWAVAQTVLGSLAGWGEKLSAVVSLVAIGVLLVILNWFYHRVYWQENLQDLHRKKKLILTGAGLSLAAAQVAGLVMLGFSSVYREGFESVLFLQAMALEAGAWTVLQGVAIGFTATVLVGLLVVSLERKLPHKKMLVVTGVLITGVLAVLVGHTVQTMQVVGWSPVTPIEGLTLPYWSGVWFGLFPTWEGLLAQGAALLFVIGSYVAAEALRKRRRARILAGPVTPSTSTPDGDSASAPSEPERPREPGFAHSV